MSIREIQRASLQKWLSEGGVGRGNELAVLDLRDESAFAKGHPLFATNLPLRRLEAVARFGIEYVEQPLPADDGAGAAELRRRVEVPVAADEAAASLVAVAVLARPGDELS